MNAARIVTAGRDSRLAVDALFAFAYQDSGLNEPLTDGNLDAPEMIPAGSYSAQRLIRHGARNVAGALLSSRTGSAA